MSNSKPARSLLIAAALVAATGTARAQTAETPSRSLAAAALAAARQTVPDAPVKKRRNTVAIGAAIGAATAAALTAGLANAYGNNAGGSFCTACFVAWGGIAIPAGAGIGAGIGLAVRRASPDQRPGLDPLADGGASRVLSGRRQELAVTFRF